MLITDHSERPAPRRTPARAKSSEPRVLIADDQSDVLEALRLLLKAEGFELETASSPAGVLAAVEAREFDVALIDLNYARDTTSGEEGLNLLSRIQGDRPDAAGRGHDGLGQRRGRGRGDAPRRARLHPEAVGQRAAAGDRPHADRAEPGAAQGPAARGRELAAARRGHAEAHRRVGRDAERAAGDRARRPVGRQRAHPRRERHRQGRRGARAARGVEPRARGRWSSSTPAASRKGVFESELFGHVRGAFTDAKSDRVGRFELADQGTLFLDEIANVPLSQQAKLLRVIETGEFERLGSSRTRRVDVRIISATNADLNDEVAGGRFRQDLLFRLNTIEIRLPPLRDRREDLPLLAQHFLRAARAALPQAAHRLRERRHADAARAQLAGQRPRARSRRRARRADGAGPARQAGGSRPRAPPRTAAAASRT